MECYVSIKHIDNILYGGSGRRRRRRGGGAEERVEDRGCKETLNTVYKTSN